MAHREVAYLLVLEGCPFAWSDKAEIAGTGGFSWIGSGNGDRRVLEGLTVPESITYSTSLESGMLESEDGATFIVQDFDQELIEFLRVPEADTVGELLRPLDDPAPNTLVSADGQTAINIWGRWVNGEACGQFGERARFSVFPGDPMPGPSHAAYVGDPQTLAPSVVTDAPTHLEGRRVALHRVFRDVTSSATGYAAWASWDDQFESGESLVWFGTLRELSAEARTWKLVCDGPSSWLRKQLNTCRPATWERIRTSVGLDDTPGQRTDLMAIDLYYIEGGTGVVAQGASSFFDEVDDTLPLSATPFFYRAAINNRLSTLAAIAGPTITWGTFYNASASLEQGYVQLRIDDAGYAACFRLIMHELAWRTLGYDPLVQQAQNFKSVFEIKFLTAETLKAQGITLPGPGYVGAEFWTAPLGFADPQSANTKADNNGETRIFHALTDESVSLLLPSGDQELVVGFGPSAPFIESQLSRPPGEHAMSEGGGNTDSTGYFAFRGSYRTSIDEEPITMVQVAKCCWVNDGSLLGAMFGANIDSERQLWLERWVDPRFMGIDRKPLDHVWASLDLEYAPLAFIGYNEKYGDRADLVLLRTMLSTGTASWSGYDGQGATRTLGANAHPDAVYDEGSDVEIADLGLGIYHELIDWTSFKRTADELPSGGGNSPLNRCKYGFIDSFDSQELVARILAPRCWGLGFVRAQFRLFSLPQTLAVEDAEVVIEPDDFCSDDQMFVEKVNLRPLQPKDKFTITYGKALVEEAAADNELAVSVRAQDKASRTRHSNAEQEIDGAGMVPVALWKGGADAPPQWTGAWSQLWSTTVAEWAGSPQVMVEDVPIMGSKARLLGPGSCVRFTSYFGPGREGTYGLTNKVGRVTKIVHDLHAQTAKVTILLQAGSATAARRFAPIAFVLDDVATVEERHDVATRTFYCYSDYFNTGAASAHDVRAFAEPDEYSIGGDAVVHGWQWNGREWAQTFSCTVESVSLADDSITYAPGSLTGTWHEGQYTAIVLAPWDDQPADSWPRALFSVITRSNFKFGSGPTPGFKLL